VRELEADRGVDLDKLAAALELAKMAKLAAMPRKRRRTLARERHDAVARMERSEIRDRSSLQNPDCAALHPGYENPRDLSTPLVPAQKREARLIQEAGTQYREAYESPAEVLARLRAEGINFDRAPEAAVKDFIDSHRPPEDDRHFRQRGAKSRRKREHARMFDWGRD
jgi:hypothetical protein